MPMGLYEHNTFVQQRMQLDGHQFIDNRFENCILVYGGGPLVMRNNKLVNVKWEFIDAAERTIGLLSSFYQQGGQSREFVEMLLTTHGKPAETIPKATTRTPDDAR